MARTPTTRWATKAAVAVAAAALLGSTLVACGGANNGDAVATSGVLKVYNDNPQWKDGFIAAGDEIKKTTGFSFDPVALPTTENYTQTVLQSLNTNKAGDIIKWWSGKNLEGLAATGKLQDLTSVWDAAVKQGQISDALRPYYSYQNKVFAVPFVQSYWVMFYSKTAYKKVGLDGPPKTWTELETAAAKLAAAGYKTCTGQSEGWTPFVPFQMFLGATSTDTYTKLINNETTFEDPAIKTAMTTWKKWIDNGWMSAPDTKTFDCAAAMKAGKIGMQPQGTWGNGLFKSAGLTDADYGAFLIPSAVDGQAPGVFLEGGALAVPAKAPHKDGALKALSAWLTVPVQTIWSEKATGDSSPNPGVVVNDPVIKGIAEQVKALKPVVLNRYYESLPPKLVASSTATLGGFMVDPKTLDQTLSDLTEQAKNEWAAWDKNPSIG